MCSNADPRGALADYIRHKTDNGNKVVDYLHDVLEDRLDGVKHLHRERAAAILTEYGDLTAIRFQEKNKEEKKAKPSAKPRKCEEREDPKFDTALARVIRDKTNDTEDVADYLIDTMNGIDSAIESGLGKIRHQQRVSAAVELLRRAFDNDPAYATSTIGHATPTVVPAKAGTQKVPGPATPEVRSEPNSIESAQLITDNSEMKIDEEPVDLVAIAKEIAENLDPSELEEEPPTPYKPSYAMWDIINKQPRPVITEEHARIGSARFNARIEQQIAWRESGVKIPTRKDYDNYDDG
ncbi:MAG: hypothetical protein F4Y49_15050 [Dehalococcoidia bacterium]|nr:hypothetical protein [Dehalococcoidia bacterium]